MSKNWHRNCCESYSAQKYDGFKSRINRPYYHAGKKMSIRIRIQKCSYNSGKTTHLAGEFDWDIIMTVDPDKIQTPYNLVIFSSNFRSQQAGVYPWIINIVTIIIDVHFPL